MVTAAAHPWAVVAPWYSWPGQQDTSPPTPLGTRPTIQKFTTDVFVDRFIDHPQRSYQFTDNDLVSPRTHPLTNGEPDLGREELATSTLRVLYLPAHDRLYLVTCEVVCDTYGFPSPAREQICQAALVVRRLGLRYAAEPPDRRAAAMTLLADLFAAVGDTDAAGKAIGPRVVPVGTENVELIVLNALERAAQSGPTGADAVLNILEATGAAVVTQAWRPACSRWVDLTAAEVDADPLDDEATIEMTPLAGSGPNHDAAGRRLFFAAIPAGSAERDALQVPRYDGRSVYQLRCFVRRHDLRCPRRSGRRDCQGPIFWSERSEPYRLAETFDPVGTSQRKVTIELPNVADLKARVAAGRLPTGARLVTPDGSGLRFTRKNGIPDTGGSFSVGGICFESIPLITLVATFVLSIFMAIVLFVFQAWWMLKLRFCLGGSSVAAVASAVQTVANMNPTAAAAYTSGGRTSFVVSDSVVSLGQLELLVTALGAENPQGTPPAERLPTKAELPRPEPGKIDVAAWVRELEQIVVAERPDLAGSLPGGGPHPGPSPYDLIEMPYRRRVEVGLR